MNPTGMIGMRFFLGSQIGEADSHLITRENYEIFLQAGMVIYRLNKA